MAGTAARTHAALHMIAAGADSAATAAKIAAGDACASARNITPPGAVHALTAALPQGSYQ